MVTGHAQHSQHLSCASEQPFVVISRSDARRDFYKAEREQRMLQRVYICSCEEKVQILQNGIPEIAAILIGVANTSSAHGVQLLNFDEC